MCNGISQKDRMWTEPTATEEAAVIDLAWSLADPTEPKLFWGWTLTPYVQCDPRAAALYIVRPDDVPPGGTLDSYYSRGVCVCK